MKQFLQSLPKYAFAAVIYLAYKARFKYYDFNGKDFSYERYLKGRWYSPVWWGIAIFCFFISLFSGGIIEWVKLMRAELKGSEAETHSYSASFKDEISPLERRIVLWRLIYLGT